MKTLIISSTTLQSKLSRLVLFVILILFAGLTRSYAQSNSTSDPTFTVNDDFNTHSGTLKLGARSGLVNGEELSISLKNTEGHFDVDYYDAPSNENRNLLEILDDARVNIGGTLMIPVSLLHMDSRAINGILDVPVDLQPQDIMNRLRFTNLATSSSINDGFAIGIYEDGSAVIEQNENKDLYFNTNATRRMIIDKDGKVAIGDPSALTCHPNATLTVDGAVFISPAGGSPADITACEINTQYLVNNYALWVDGGMVAEDFAISDATDWADFVFAEDYQLPTLEDVEMHINEKGHLPNIPSAEEVKEGYNLHKMNTQMLQTIEELTLHTIEQNKQIKALMERVEQLEQK